MIYHELQKYQLWMAEYPDYEVTPYPNYNYFPSFENIGIFSSRQPTLQEG